MNPYKILDIDYCATKREIIQAAARAMRERKYSGREVAVAQKELLNPITKAAHDFLQFIDVKPLQEQLVLTWPNDQDKRTASEPSATPPEADEGACLSRLTVFDEDS